MENKIYAVTVIVCVSDRIHCCDQTPHRSKEEGCSLAMVSGNVSALWW